MSNEREKLIELLSAYLDDELTGQEIAEVQELLASSSEAQEIYARLSSTTNLFKSINPVAPPPDLKEKIIKRLNIQNRISFFQRIKDKVSARKINFPVLTYASASLILIFFIVYPITLMLDWPESASPTASLQADNDPFDFSGDNETDETMELYAAAPELDDYKDQTDFLEEPEAALKMEKKKAATAENELQSGEPESETAARVEEMQYAEAEETTGGIKNAERRSRNSLALDKREEKEEEKITVTGEAPIVDVRSTDTNMKIDKELFQALPKGRNFDSIVALAPGVQEKKRDVTIDGASSEENIWAIDGKATEKSLQQGNQYWVDVVDAYFDLSIKDLNGNHEKKKTVVTDGAKPTFSMEAESGSNDNPIIYNSKVSPILPTLDFTFEDRLANDFIMILGEVHISRDGKVLFYRIECPAAARKLVARYGEKLMNTFIQPAIFNSNRVSVFYRFIATIYRNDNKTE